MQIRPDGLDVCAPMADMLVFHIYNMACAIRILGHAKATEKYILSIVTPIKKWGRMVLAQIKW